MKSTIQVTFQSGSDAIIRQAFLKNAKLSNNVDSAFRKVSDNWSVSTAYGGIRTLF